MDLKDKNEKLNLALRACNSLLVAFSGGVDSTFLLAAAHEALGDRVLAVTAYSPVHPLREKDAARDLAAKMGVKHLLVASEEMDDADFILNQPDRCYRCKVRLFRRLLEIASEKGIRYVAHGANADDVRDYRPGQQAADELEILAPLMEAGLTKNEIRKLSREMGLTTWDKPAMACLATRIPYGETLTPAKLGMVEHAEAVLYELGFGLCRVRHHGSLARIEVHPDAFRRLLQDDVKNVIVRRLLKIGYTHVAMDLEGYMQGSMNKGVVNT